MKQSKRQLEIEARRAADPIAQALGRTDIDYSTDELPTAPRSVVPIISADFKGDYSMDDVAAALAEADEARGFDSSTLRDSSRALIVLADEVLRLRSGSL